MNDHELRETVNAACECGGGGPNDAHSCAVCRLYHAVKAAEAKLAEVSRTRDTAVELHGIASTKIARIREAWGRYDVDHEPGMASVVEPRTLVALRAAIEDE